MRQASDTACLTGHGPNVGYLFQKHVITLNARMPSCWPFQQWSGGVQGHPAGPPAAIVAGAEEACAVFSWSGHEPRGRSAIFPRARRARLGRGRWPLTGPVSAAAHQQRAAADRARAAHRSPAAPPSRRTPLGAAPLIRFSTGRDRTPRATRAQLRSLPLARAAAAARGPLLHALPAAAPEWAGRRAGKGHYAAAFPGILDRSRGGRRERRRAAVAAVNRGRPSVDERGQSGRRRCDRADRGGERVGVT